MTPRVLAFVVLLVVAILAAALVLILHRRTNGARRRAQPEASGGGAFRLKVSDPEYTAMVSGKKTVEARLDRPPFNRLKAGDPVTVVRARPRGDESEYPGGRYKYTTEVARVGKYSSIAALLKAEGASEVYPGLSAAKAAERFGAYLPPGTGAEEPVLAIELHAPGAHDAHAKKAPAKRAAKRPEA
jgi:ASC-1-like (ASCH) protein